MRLRLLSLLAALVVAGCATTGGKGDVDELHLFGMPVTLNMDSKPGADGVAVRIFATKGGSAKGSAISSGAIEMLMFDGVMAGPEALTAPPKQVWKYTARDLKPFREEKSLGTAYQLALRWNEPPKRGHVTVIARYLPPKGEPVYSSPSTITAAVK